MYRSKTISVVLPCYNEQEGIGKAIEEFCATGWVDEIIVVDNNSSDCSAAIVKGTKARLVTEQRQGYGYALRKGMESATGEIIILAEPDGTFVARDILKLLAYSDDFDVVLGTRTTRELIWSGANMGMFLQG